MRPKKEGPLPVVQASCQSLDSLGQGVCKSRGNVLFVRGVLPGEEAQVQLASVKGNTAFGTLLRLLKKSPARIPCPKELLEAGVGDLGHLSYEERLLYKQRTIRDLLKRFAKLDVPVLPTIPCPVQEGFRNKIQRPVRKDPKTGRAVSGYYRVDTHRLIPMERCPVESPLAGEVLQEVMRLVDELGIPPYDEDSEEGLLRHVLIRTSHRFHEALLTLVVASRDVPSAGEIARKLMARCPEVKGVTLNVNPRRTNVILGMEDRLIAGREFIIDSILDRRFQISSRSFYQTNPYLVDALYQKVIDSLSLTGREEVLDAYCGTGTIALCLASKAKGVVGVELESSSYRDALENAKINGVTNASFALDDATEFMEKTRKKFDAIVLDPPRKGTTERFIKAVFQIRPTRVCYVSCDPATLARDLNLFKREYEILSAQGVDLFPTSHHVETVVAMRRKGS